MWTRGRIGSLLLGLWLAPAAARAVGDGDDRLVAIFWKAPGASSGDAVGDAFARAVEERHGALLPSTMETAVASLAPRLEAALVEYRAFHFAAAAELLTDLGRVVTATGGGDLDPRQLAELHLYRALARLELEQPEAWDDFVRAARLDPDRALDPAQFPPRAVAALRRAVADAAALPRSELVVELPPGAALRFDGRAATSPIATTVGAHLLQIAAPGATPWAGEIVVSGAHERLEPSLAHRSPPTLDELSALGRRAGAGRVLLGALLVDTDGARFFAHLVDLRHGSAASAERAIDAASAARAVGEVLGKLAPLPFSPSVAPAALIAPLRPARSFARRFAWLWAVFGAVTVAAIALPLGLVLGRSSPDVGGALGPIP